MSQMMRGTAAAVLATLALAGCQGIGQQAVAPNTLVAAKVAAAPNMSALAADPAWAGARPVAMSLTDGANFDKGQTTGTLKAVYTGDTLYMLVQYKDPTDSVRRGPYQKQADGSWKQLKDPANKGGDDNVYYEDKWAFIWSIDDSIKGFAEQGCAVMCHEGQGKPYGNKYTTSAGELGDIWHAKGQRTIPVGFVDDQYVDHTRYDPQKSPNAGRKN
ncbi:MAG TPA: ethylbenzene dehydrogenase-related protein, partial [Ramlibacter sp.]